MTTRTRLAVTIEAGIIAGLIARVTTRDEIARPLRDAVDRFYPEPGAVSAVRPLNVDLWAEIPALDGSTVWVSDAGHPSPPLLVRAFRCPMWCWTVWTAMAATALAPVSSVRARLRVWLGAAWVASLVMWLDGRMRHHQ